MDGREYLHDGELLYVQLHPTKAALIAQLTRFVCLTAAVGIAVAILLWFGLTAAGIRVHPLWLAPLPLVLAFLSGWVTHGHWRAARFRVTNERILLEYKDGILVHPMMPVASDPKTAKRKPKAYSLVTIKWNQYQESSLPAGSLIDTLIGARPLAIRYGSADGHMIAFFPSLPFAKDLKHYLDKVDSAVRRGQEAEVKPFVLKPRGQRD